MLTIHIHDFAKLWRERTSTSRLTSGHSGSGSPLQISLMVSAVILLASKIPYE